MKGRCGSGCQNKSSEERSRFQSSDPSGEQQNLLLQLGVDLGLRGLRVLLEEVCDAEDAVPLRRSTETPSESPTAPVRLQQF